MVEPNIIATKVLYGKIYTGDSNATIAEAVAIKDNTIIYVGSKDGAQSYISTDKTQVIQANQDSLVMPGFIDTHLHPLMGHLRNFSLMFRDPYEEPIATPESFREELKKYHEAHQELDIIIGFNMGYTHFPDFHPKRYYLDKVCEELSINKPVFLLRYDYHCLLLNTRALQLCRITRDTVYPPPNLDLEDRYEGDHLTGVWPDSNLLGAKIEKGEDGEPTGCLFDGAMALVRGFVPKDSFQILEQALTNAINQMLSEGITTFMDAAVKPYKHEVYKRRYSEPTKLSGLPRCCLSIGFSKDLFKKVSDPANKEKKLAEILEFKENDKFTVDTVKFFADGVLADKTACICCEYHGGHSASPYYNHEDFCKYIETLHLKGIRCHIHALGDGAVKSALDAFQAVKEKNPNTFDPRHYTAHNWLIADGDVERFAKYNITANFSPFWFYLPIEMWPVLKGKTEGLVQFPVRDFINKNVKIVFGSDWPVTTMRPLDGIEVAITRKPLDKPEMKSDHGEHSMTLQEALNGYHNAAAWLFRKENELGSIEVGKKADIIILDKDITKCKVEDIHKAKVIKTLVDGEVAWELKAEREYKY